MNNQAEPLYAAMTDRDLLEIITRFISDWDYNSVIEDDVDNCLADPGEDPDAMDLLRTDHVVFMTALEAAKHRIEK